ncbi:MAG: hypothetical protein GF307_01775 [candidate division Zixibacteria bacterium]|nr:hypothetical protein [candidate division Zixibacteria bacterium]
MNSTTLEKLVDFIRELHGHLDEMHGLEHKKRLLDDARHLGKGKAYDDDLLVFGAYLHGLKDDEKSKAVEFLQSFDFNQPVIDDIIKVALESEKDAEPETTEGALLHDAHLIEGGKYFGIAKSLVTGTLSGQTLLETLVYIENNHVGRFKCVFPEAQEIYTEKDKFTGEFVRHVKRVLNDEK